MHEHHIDDPVSICWVDAVDVDFPDGRRRRVKGPCEAMRCLIHEWPVDQGVHYETAKEACLAAMHHIHCPEEARAAFVAAIEEADFPALRRQLEDSRGIDHDRWADVIIYFHR